MTIAKVVRKVNLYRQPSEYAYRQSQPVEARLATLEQLRRDYHTWKYHAEPRLQRVLTMVRHPS